VFPFTDLNEAINIAGEGINMLSRLLGMADPGRPLVSAKAYDQILDGSSALADHFEKVDTQLVKHGVKIDAYWYTRLAR
jgi:class 3 adenylate cyclase